MWLRIVWARRSASTTASTGLADAKPAVERAAVDDEAADRRLRVGDREQHAPAARLAEDAPVADLAAALGVERRLVEDDLGFAVAGQLVELHAVAQDRDDASLGGRRLVAEERRVAGARLDRVVQRGELGVLRQLGLRPGPAAVALLGERQLEAGPVDADAVLGGELDGQVDRKAVGVVEPEGDVARRPWRVGGEVLGRRPTTRSASVEVAISAASSWPVPASSVRANCASSRAMRPGSRRAARRGAGTPRP